MTSRNSKLPLSVVVLGLIVLMFASVRAVPLPAQGESAESGDAPAATVVDGTKPAADSPDTEKQWSLAFQGAPWRLVLDSVAKEAGMTLDMDDVPPGTFSYIGDAYGYTLSESLDILNGYLFTRGYYLARRDKFLVVVNLADGIPDSLVPRIAPAELPRRGANEIVTVLVRLPTGVSGTANVVTSLNALLGRWGRITTLHGTRQLLVQGRVANVRDIVENLSILEPAKDGNSSRSKAPTTKVDDSASVKGPTPPLVDASGRRIKFADSDNDLGLDVVVIEPARRNRNVEATGDGRFTVLAEIDDSAVGARFRAEDVLALIDTEPSRVAARDVLASLKAKYDEAERDTARLAAEYRQARERLPEADPTVAEIRTRMQGLVRDAFERRQQAQRLEAEILRRQLRRVDERLADRERLKERIAERRLQELLDPNLNWESKSAAPQAGR